jgi:hypothetical protein
VSGIRGVDIIDSYLNLGETHHTATRPQNGSDGHPTQYLFGDYSEREDESRSVAGVVATMDRHGIEQAQLNVSSWDRLPVAEEIMSSYPGRFTAAVRIDPHQLMAEVARIREARARLGDRLSSVSIVPFLLEPRVPATDAHCYVIYALCSELGLTVNVNAGIPGPRVPGVVQDPVYLDQVCYDFPDLTVVIRHGGDPWGAMCAKLLLKWPNLYYSTDAFAPRHYLKEIIDFANTRGKEKVLYGGYYPALSYDRIMTELDALPLKDDVWPYFLRHNSERAYGMECRSRR